MRQALRRLGSLGPRGVVGFFLLPALVPCVLGASLDEDLSAPARVLTLGLVPLFLAGWLFLLAAVLPQRWGPRLASPMAVLGLLGMLVMGGAALWAGVEGLSDGPASESGASWGYLACGAFFVVVAGLLALRAKLPWNRKR